jgi:hypothetical protein
MKLPVSFAGWIHHNFVSSFWKISFIVVAILRIYRFSLACAGLCFRVLGALQQRRRRLINPMLQPMAEMQVQDEQSHAMSREYHALLCGYTALQCGRSAVPKSMQNARLQARHWYEILYLRF